MKTLKEHAKEQAEVMLHFWNGGEVEYAYRTSANKNWEKIYEPSWDWDCYIYRIAVESDPYAELKAAAEDPTKQVRCSPFREDDSDWHDSGYPWSWAKPVDDYEIRDKPKPEPKKVKFLAYATSCGLSWYRENRSVESHWKRVPSEDKEVEIEE